MDSSLRSISKIFNEKIYRIPDYQRGYAWGEKQIVDYWGDVFQLNENNNHYVGVVTLESVPKEAHNEWSEDKWIIEGKNYEPFYVVDGQQRLTTTVILIQAICEVAQQKNIKKLNYTTISEIRKKYIFESHDGDISRSYIFGYEKDNPSYEFLKIKIFNENSISGYSKEETIYTNNLEFAKNYFKTHLKKLDKSEIERIFKKVTQQLLFNTYSIQSDIDVFIAFETMNNRGLRLSNLELLKNRLIYLSTKFSVPDEDKNELRRNINNAWRSIYHYLGKNKLNPLRDDAFLYNHTLTYFGDVFRRPSYITLGPSSRYVQRRDLSEELSALLLDNIFSIKRYDNKDNDKVLLEITPQTIKAYVENISSAVETWFALKNPILAPDFNDEEKLWMDKLNRNEYANLLWPTLLNFYLQKPTKSQSLHFLKLLENYCFYSYLRSYHFINKSDRAKLTETRSKASVKNILNKLEKMSDAVKNSEEPLTERLEHYGFYEWGGIKYFLYEYELSLKDKSKTKRQKINWDEYNKEADDYITVEHIYPKTDSIKYWTDRYSRFTGREKRTLRDSLGNLLPLSRAKNSSLQNKSFSHKVDNGKGVGYRSGSYAENEISGLQDWLPENILERGMKLLDFMEQRWDISLGDYEKKLTLLKLNFLSKDKQSSLDIN